MKKQQRETINIRTRVTQDIQRYKEIEDQLIELYSREFMDSYRVYCFNYSCLEAEHLKIPVHSESLEDLANFNKLRRFRSEVLMDELLAFTLAGADHEEKKCARFAKECEPHYIFPTEEEIKNQIKERYGGKSVKNFKNS